MRKILFSLAAFALMAGMGALAAQNQSEISSPDSDKTNAHDRPLGTVVIKLPSGSNGNGDGSPSPEPPVTEPAPPSEGEDIPPTETPPNPPPPEEPPPYYGEPIEGKFVFLLDASGSMYGSRVATVRAETANTIQGLTEDHEFDVVSYSSRFGQSQDYSVFMWGALLPGTEGNKSAAISWVNGSNTNPSGGTPTYACLKKSCSVYPSDLDKMFLLTDGSPNTSGSASQILSDFPSWWTKFDDAELICICIGGHSGAQQFMQNLAALAGGTYVAA